MYRLRFDKIFFSYTFLLFLLRQIPILASSGIRRVDCNIDFRVYDTSIKIHKSQGLCNHFHIFSFFISIFCFFEKYELPQSITDLRELAIANQHITMYSNSTPKLLFLSSLVIYAINIVYFNKLSGLMNSQKHLFLLKFLKCSIDIPKELCQEFQTKAVPFFINLLIQ